MIDIENIRKMKDQQNMSFRQIALATGHSRNTVKKWYQLKDFPQYQRIKAYTPIKNNIIEQIKRWIDDDLASMKTNKNKRIRNASTIWNDLKNINIDCGYSTVRRYVRELKPKEVYIPIEYEPGVDMQVDWGIYEIKFMAGISIKVNLFVATLPYSNTRFVYPYYKADQMSFFDGHIKAFDFFGGIPRRITYDNLTSAIKRVLNGVNRVEQDKMIHFKSYYGFESNYCGVAKGNEKGSVENGVGYCKRRFLSGEYKVNNFDELRKYLIERCENALLDKHYKKKRDINELLDEEKIYFFKKPDVPYDCSNKIITRSNSSLCIEYDGVKYSIPSEYCQKTVTLKATTDEIIVQYADKEIVRYKRSHKAFQKEIFDFRHYLPVIFKKPRALDNARCIKKAGFPNIFYVYLDELKARDYNGNKEMARILMLHKLYDIKDIFFALEWGHTNKAYGYEAVLMTLRDLYKETSKVETISTNYPFVKLSKTDLNKYDTLIGGLEC